MKKKEIKLVEFINLRYADPISAIDLIDNYLLFGSMLGSITLYIIGKKKLIKLSDTEDEYISGVKIKENILYICIGDLKITTYEVTQDDNILPKDSTNNYKNEEEHNKNCENCLTMLNNDYLIRTFIDFPEEPNKEPSIKLVKYSIKNIIDNKEFEGKIRMSNYTVPFDFNGTYYIYIDFLKKNKRKFGIHDVTTENENGEENKENEEENIENEEEKENKDNKVFIIENFKEKIGHISHLKIIKNNKIFIVRDYYNNYFNCTYLYLILNLIQIFFYLSFGQIFLFLKYNICEIRNCNFELIKKLNIKSNEILNFDIIFNVIGEDNNENKSESKNIKENNNDNPDDESFYLILIDIDCNIILYNSKEDKSEILFNLETDNLNIDKDIKEQKFFSFGYTYYIRMTKKYIAISSDYGCILVQYSL